MTISNSNNRTRLAVSGLTYDFTFTIDNEAEILVYVITDDVASLLTLATDYTVSISSIVEGGTVTLTGASSADEILMIRNKAYQQTADIPIRSGFNEAVIEGALDNLEMQIQQLKELLDFSVKQDLTAVPVPVIIPTPEDGLALVWDGTAGALRNSPVDAGAVSDGIVAAQAAQTAAEAAQTAAETAQSLAEAAKVAAQAAVTAIYPVGIVVTLGVSTNPATLFGFGTWAAIAGRVIVGIDAGQTEFDTLNETGGEKTHLLTSAESGLPAHNHTESQFTASGGSPEPAASIGGGGNAYHNQTGQTGTNGAVDAISAHNNLQPYIVKYVWQRTA